MNIKIIGAGCATCRRMHHAVQMLVARLNLDARVDNITNVEQILSNRILGTPVLVIDEQVMMMGPRGAKKIEAILQHAADMQK